MVTFCWDDFPSAKGEGLGAALSGVSRQANAVEAGEIAENRKRLIRKNIRSHKCS
jgi:hypothetical protein